MAAVPVENRTPYPAWIRAEIVTAPRQRIAISPGAAPTSGNDREGPPERSDGAQPGTRAQRLLTGFHVKGRAQVSRREIDQQARRHDRQRLLHAGHDLEQHRHAQRHPQAPKARSGPDGQGRGQRRTPSGPHCRGDGVQHVRSGRQDVEAQDRPSGQKRGCVQSQPTGTVASMLGRFENSANHSARAGRSPRQSRAPWRKSM